MVREPNLVKECQFCAETIKSAAIRCRHCHSDLPTPKESHARKSDVLGKRLRSSVARLRTRLKGGLKRAKNTVTPRTLIAGAAVLILLLAAGLTLFFTNRHYQEQHYQAGQSALANEDYPDAIQEFRKAGGYANARDLTDLIVKYNNAIIDMNGSRWKRAYSLLTAISKKDNGFQDVAGKIDNLEWCPQTPIYFYLTSQSGIPGIHTVAIQNLLGETVGGIRVYGGWSYSNLGAPNLMSTINIMTNSGQSLVLAVQDDPKYHKATSGFIVAANGVQLDLADYRYNYHFVIKSVTNINHPSLPDGGSGNPVFGQMTLEIDVSPR